MKTDNTRNWFFKVAQLGLTVGLLWGLAGCDEDGHDFVDVTPPAVPTGVSSITGDREVILSWIPNREPDLSGYHILSNTDGGAEYFIIATIDADDPNYYEPGQGLGDDLMFFVDDVVDNGIEYWYAIIAFDRSGNESDLSYEYVRDVPRPEGFTTLFDVAASPALSGFDFSDRSGDPVPWDSPAADVYLETDGSGVLYLVSADPLVRLQDYGLISFDGASIAPEFGWSRTGRLEVIAGHTYMFEIAADTSNNSPVNYAKLWISDLFADAVDGKWGYQEIGNEWQLKNPAGRADGNPDQVKEVMP